MVRFKCKNGVASSTFNISEEYGPSEDRQCNEDVLPRLHGAVRGSIRAPSGQMQLKTNAVKRVFVIQKFPGAYRARTCFVARSRLFIEKLETTRFWSRSFRLVFRQKFLYALTMAKDSKTPFSNYKSAALPTQLCRRPRMRKPF